MNEHILFDLPSSGDDTVVGVANVARISVAVDEGCGCVVKLVWKVGIWACIARSFKARRTRILESNEDGLERVHKIDMIGVTATLTRSDGDEDSETTSILAGGR